MVRLAVVIAALAGCGADPGADAPGPFDYTGTVSWNVRELPEVQSVTVDGHLTTTGLYSFRHVFAGYSEAAAFSFAVEVATTTGSASFALVPTACGGACDHDGEACTAMTSETDQWSLARGPTALEIDPLEGYCAFVDGSGAGYSQ